MTTPTRSRTALLLAVGLILTACGDPQLADLDTEDISTSDTAPPDATTSDDTADDTAPPDATTSDDTAADLGADTEADAVDPTVLMPLFDLASNRFFDRPWPDDDRRTEDGRLDMSGFPSANSNSMLRQYLDEVEQLRGFSVAPVIYLRFSGPLERATLPEPAETLSADAAIQLVRVDAEGCGERLPVIVTFRATGDRFMPSNSLTVRPVPGFWLEPAATYAALVTRSLGAGDALQTRPAPDFTSRLATADSYAPLRNCAEQAGLDLEALAVATVFTTQDATRELHVLRDHALGTDAPVVRNWQHVPELDQEGLFTAWFADYDTPMYQRGESPYDSDGAFVFDQDGAPVLQRWESVPMTVLVPVADHPGPRPVLVWLDGTGATRTSHLRRAVIHKALQAGFVVASFVPQMHDGRSPDSADPVMHSFNYLNPTSGRCVFRQQAVDTAYFVRVLREGLDPERHTGLPELDPDALVYGGHSQGAIVGGLLAGVETEFDAYVLNGVGGYLSVTVEERKDPFDVAATVATFFGLNRSAVTVEHPIVQIAQTNADVVDPHSYAHDYLGHAAHPSGINLFMINGFNDHTTYPRSIDALTIRADSDVLAPAGWDVDPFDVWSREPVEGPLQGNRTARDGVTPRTVGTFLSATHGHYTLHEVPALQDSAVAFWLSAISGDGAPVIE